MRIYFCSLGGYIDFQYMNKIYIYYTRRFSTMKNSKVIKNFKSLIEQSKKNLGDSFFLEITDESVEMHGITDKPVKLQDAILFIRKNNQTFIRGFFDKEKYEFSSIRHLSASSNILIGVDYSDINNNLIYLNLAENYFIPISSSELSKDDVFYLYWEYQNSFCLTSFEYDPLEDTIALETFSMHKKSLQKILRTFVQKLLSVHKNYNINSSFFSENLIIEEIEDSNVKSNDKEVYLSESEW